MVVGCSQPFCTFHPKMKSSWQCPRMDACLQFSLYLFCTCCKYPKKNQTYLQDMSHLFENLRGRPLRGRSSGTTTFPGDLESHHTFLTLRTKPSDTPTRRQISQLVMDWQTFQHTYTTTDFTIADGFSMLIQQSNNLKSLGNPGRHKRPFGCLHGGYLSREQWEKLTNSFINA